MHDRFEPGSFSNVDDWVDSVCDAFESSFREDPATTIESFQQAHEISSHEQLMCEWIRLEMDLRLEVTAAVWLGHYHQRFPSQLESIEASWRWLIQARKTAVLILNVPIEEMVSNQVSISLCAGLARIETLPETIGPYSIETIVGQGAFGLVVSAIETETGTKWALKFPKSNVLQSQGQLESLVSETGLTHQLNHPAMIASQGLEQHGQWIFLVQKFAEGTTLRERLERPMKFDRAASITLEIARALAHAHQMRIYHRDLKPENVILDPNGKPKITDFGLAMFADHQHDHRGQRSGTPYYMSPEIVQGRSDHIDGRSDLWSLGVMFYEMLTQRKPFVAQSTEALFEEILKRPVRSPREFDPNIDPALETICLRCLKRDPSERFATATDLALSISEWQTRQTAKSARGHGKRAFEFPGLRSFRERDSETYHQLLPGERDPDGIPLEIAEWRRRLENRQPEKAFPVSIVYGSSGCGKSSFVQAGIMPVLDRRIVAPVYVECRAGDLESRLRAALETRIKNPPTETRLSSIVQQVVLDELQTQGDRKLVVILDQFEQWLHESSAVPASELMDAMKVSDGIRVQFLLIVRDDFWAATSRLMREIGCRMDDRANTGMVDQFDLPHAQKVLHEFGTVLGRLPADDLSADQKAFVERSVEQMSEDGRVVCVRLVLFAEMLKNESWSTATLKKKGGARGIGEAFLDEHFSATHRDRNRQRLVPKIEKILRALLPDPGKMIRDQFVSETQLAESVGEALQDADFRSAIELLDQLKIITPADSENSTTPQSPEEEKPQSEKNFQLTHDYLVPSIRNWLRRNMEMTWRGRAEKRLIEYEDQAGVSENKRVLPGIFETIWLHVAVSKNRRSIKASQLLRQARRRHSLLVSSASLLFVLMASIVGWWVYRHQQQKNAFQEFLVCSSSDLGDRLDGLEKFDRNFRNEIRDTVAGKDKKKAARAAILDVFINKELKKEYATFLFEQLDHLDHEEFRQAVRALNRHPNSSYSIHTEYIEYRNAKDSIRHVVLALEMGNGALIENYGSKQKYHEHRAKFIIEYAELGTHFEKTLPLLHKDRVSNLTKQTLIVSLARIPTETASNLGLTSAIEKLVRSHPNGGVHSACRAALASWSQSGRLPVFGDLATNEPPTDRDWWVADIAGCKIEFIKIPAGSFTRTPRRNSNDDGKMGFVSEGVWMTACEVPLQLVVSVRSKLGSEAGFDTKESLAVEKFHSPQFPATIFTLDQVAMICNTINEMEHFEKLNLSESAAFEMTSQRMVAMRPGRSFRIPTPDEHEWATRSGCKVLYPWGNSTDLRTAGLFAHFSGNVIRRAKTFSGAKLPNAFGYFDLSGNVSEFCVPFAGDESLNFRCFLRGGACHNAISFLGLDFVMIDLITEAPGVIENRGFRLVLDLGPQAETANGSKSKEK